MVVKMMRWRPWPPLISKKFEVKLVVQKIEGGDWLQEGAEKDNGGLALEIRWKGPRISLSSFRRSIRRNFTRVETLRKGPNGDVFVVWDEEFRNVCSLSGYKDTVFHPWEISFSVLLGLNQGTKNKILVAGTAALNLAHFASRVEGQIIEVQIPLTVSSAIFDHQPILCLSLSLSELGSSQQESLELAQSPVLPVPSPSVTGESSVEKVEVSALKAGLRKVKIFTEYVSTRRAKKACREDDGSEGRCSAKSDEGESAYPFDLDTVDLYEEGQSDENKDDLNVRKSFSYGTLAYANYTGVSYYSNARINSVDEDWIYYSNRHRSDAYCPRKEEQVSGDVELSLLQNSKRSILPWRKRKLSFRSPKAKGEPLLKKSYGEEGGDDIDFDRRQLSSDESLPCGWHNIEDGLTRYTLSVSEFGDDSFTVGTWEQREIISRDGHMKIQTEVFFASIDQRSERAAGEGACTVLVAVIANWLQHNHDLMPIKSQFDSLIRDGSSEWRKLCEQESYKERFPDKHFDLETVLQTKIRDLTVVPEKSFIGFFHPDEMEGANFDFLHDAMSFDNIWDEINHSANSDPQVFIVSWNDHFFVLKVEKDVYYIIDTLGERLHEGCNQAYILKFDRSTIIYELSNTEDSSEEKPADKQHAVDAAVGTQNLSAQSSSLNEDYEDKLSGTLPEKSIKPETEEEIVCTGKESCKAYIKNFLAAIPIRELIEDSKKGLTMSVPLHCRLQIEFNFTKLQGPTTRIPSVVAATSLG